MFIAAIAAGLLVRIPAFGASLWLDELTTLWAVEGPLTQVLHRVPQVMGQSPFYFVIAWASLHLFGETEMALRLPSLLAAAACAVAIGLCAHALCQRAAAGLWAAALFWCSYPSVWFSVDARPYAFALCFTAMACLGFVRSVQRGRLVHRTLWIAGAAGTIWAHVLFAPFIAGLAAAYLLLPGLRATWRPRAFWLDAGLAAVALLPMAKQVHDLVVGRSSQDWVSQAPVIGVLGLIAPFALAALMPARSRRLPLESALTIAFWGAMAAELIALGASSLVGPQLFVPRYASVVIVAAAILAGANLARLGVGDLVAPLAIYLAINGASFYATRTICASWSGAGYQDWRGAVADLKPLIARDPTAPILYRSGNAEDDPARLSERWPAWRAPLRSPGEAAPDWRLVDLTYQWTDPARHRYFETTVASQIADRPSFYLLCLASDEGAAGRYCENVERWIDQRWPGRFRAEPLAFHRQLRVVRFERAAGGPPSR